MHKFDVLRARNKQAIKSKVNATYSLQQEYEQLAVKIKTQLLDMMKSTHSSGDAKNLKINKVCTKLLRTELA